MRGEALDKIDLLDLRSNGPSECFLACSFGVPARYTGPENGGIEGGYIHRPCLAGWRLLNVFVSIFRQRFTNHPPSHRHSSHTSHVTLSRGEGALVSPHSAAVCFAAPLSAWGWLVIGRSGRR